MTAPRNRLPIDPSWTDRPAVTKPLTLAEKKRRAALRRDLLAAEKARRQAHRSATWGLRCPDPTCRHDQSRVKYTRPRPWGLRRVRICLKCGRHITSRELVEP